MLIDPAYIFGSFCVEIMWCIWEKLCTYLCMLLTELKHLYHLISENCVCLFVCLCFVVVVMPILCAQKHFLFLFFHIDLLSLSFSFLKVLIFHFLTWIPLIQSGLVLVFFLLSPCICEVNYSNYILHETRSCSCMLKFWYWTFFFIFLYLSLVLLAM